MKYLLFTFSLLFSLQTLHAQSRINYSNYQKTIHDQFQYPSTTALNDQWQLTIAPKFTPGTAVFTEHQVSLLPEGGLRLTASPLTQGLAARDPQSKMYYYSSGLIARQLKEDYGIFEIIAKLPNGNNLLHDAWPVFKLVGENTEINIFDGSQDINDQLLQNIRTKTNNTTIQQCGSEWNLEDFHNGWDQDFHVFQLAWTPDKITFFIHGREISTVDVSNLEIPSNLTLVIALQTNEASAEPIQMDIQAVNVFSHKAGRPYTYMADYSWEFHHATSAMYDMPVMPMTGSIAPNLNNTTQVFYLGTDHQLYLVTKNNGEFTTRQIGNHPIAGDLTFVKATNTLVFRSQEGYLAGYHLQGNDFHFFTKKAIRLAEQQAISPTATGNLIVILKNHKMVNLSPKLSIQAMTNLYAKSDVVATPQGIIFYKNQDNKVAAIQPQGISYIPVTLPNIELSNDPGAILYTTFPTGKGIALRGSDNKFHLLEEITPSTYHHSVQAYGYGTQDPNHSDYIASNVTGNINDVFYVSDEGRLEMFGWIPNTTTRTHYWIDDNWFTENYLADTAPNAASLVKGANATLYYRTKSGNLGLFTWETSSKGCDCATIHLDNNHQTSGTEININTFPNPTIGQLNIQLTNNCADCTYEFELVNARGQQVLAGKFIGAKHQINLTNLASGMYQLNVHSEGVQFAKRVVKLK